MVMCLELSMNLSTPLKYLPMGGASVSDVLDVVSSFDASVFLGSV